MVPWFTVVIIFLILLLLLFKMFGDIDLSAAVKETAVYWSLIAVGLIIFMAALGNVFGQGLTDQAAQGNTVAVNGTSGSVETGDFDQNVNAIIFHPKVLGMIVLFVIAIFAVLLLTT